MIAAMFVLLSDTAAAVVVPKAVDVCVEVDTAFDDNAGDWWTTDAPKAARGFEYEITDANTTYTGHLSAGNGCLDDFVVYVNQINGTFNLKVRSAALVNGVEMESWEGASLNPRQFVSQTWTINTGSGGSVSVTKQITSLDTRWTNLLVGTMTFRQYDWNVEDPIERDCCLESAPTYDLDGTCNTPWSGGYGLITTPIQFQTVPDGGCCASVLQDSDGVSQNEPPGVSLGEDFPWKFTVAHELGHVIAEMRTGAKEWEQYPLDAPMDNCNGDHYLDPDPGDSIVEYPIFDKLQERGEFTKEYLADALREGWANFVSAATWNDRTQDDCEFQVVFQRHDYDLDGIVDDARSNTDLIGAYDCEGIPTISGDPAIASYVTSENWLADLVGADDNDVDGLQCVAAADPDVEEFNRATVFDVTRMLWDLTTDQGLQPGKLSNLYVDMCPRGWDPGDTAVGTDASPYERLLLSADGQGITTEVIDEITHIDD